jgi:hypothetical protein
MERPRTFFPMEESKLFTITYHLLNSRPRHVSYAQITMATGIPEAWLRKFGAGRMRDPSVVRVEKLYNALADAPLNLPYELPAASEEFDAS